MNTTRPLIFTIALVLATSLTACATSDFLPKSQWARFDGHDVDLTRFDDYSSSYGIVSIDAEDVDNRYAARTATNQINCLRLDCKLHPGSHTVEVSYRWVETDIEKKRHRKEALKGVGFATLAFLGVVTGAGIPDPPKPATDPSSMCFAALTFEAHARHHYILLFIDADGQIPPDEIRIVDIDSGNAIVASSPLC